MHVIFEDSEHSALSKFLQKSTQITAHFAGSNTNLLNKYKELSEASMKNTEFVIVVDVSFDTIETSELYYDLLVESEKYDNLKIVSIPCIEFYLIKCFCDNRQKPVHFVLNQLDYSKEDWTVYGMKQKHKNAEKFAKDVAYHFLRPCMRAYDDQNSSKFSRWYRNDCLCKQIFQKCKPYTLEIKVKDFVSSLPIKESPQIQQSNFFK